MSKKICILTDSLSSGGAEKVAANMSISLSKKGYEVFVVSMQDKVDYPYDGQLYNFGKVKASNHILRAFFKFRFFFKKHPFDAVIDHRVRDKFLKEFLFSRFVFNKQGVIYCIHSHDLNYYFSFLSIPKLALLPHVKKKKFIAVSNQVKSHLLDSLKTESEVIYNYLIKNDLKIVNTSHFDFENYIIGVGRLSKVKQFDKLILAYSKSKLPKSDIQLIIMGDGDEKEVLEQMILDLKLNSFVKLLPFKENPYKTIQNAKALILTSKVEGFGIVLIEALALKTPVVAFDCKSGPSEIINHEVNGLLVENQNLEALTLALNKLMDEPFYKQLKQHTHVGLEKFSESNAIEKWIDIFENPNKYF